MTLTAEVVTSVKEKAKKQSTYQKLGLLQTEEKNEALLKIAETLEQQSDFILQENQKDLEAGKEKGFSEALMDRLMLNEERIHEFAESLRLVTRLTDPVGEILDEWTLENGLHVKSRRVPLGVIGMIYEARPNVTVDAAGLALKAGNSVILKAVPPLFLPTKPSSASFMRHWIKQRSLVMRYSLLNKQTVHRFKRCFI